MFQEDFSLRHTTIISSMPEDDIKLAVDSAEDAFGVVAKRHPEIEGLK